MFLKAGSWRLWAYIAAMICFVSYIAENLVGIHLDPDINKEPKYEFEVRKPSRRGSIYDRGGKPLAESIPVWEYRLDPVSLTNRVVRMRGELPRKREAIIRTIADALGLNYAAVLKMANNPRNRYQYLSTSSDPESHRIIADSRLVAGVIIEDTQIRQYFQGRRLSHVLGSTNKQHDGSSGLELKYDNDLRGVDGYVKGIRDGRGRELYDKRKETIAPVPGVDITLTIDNNLQYEADCALSDGIKTYGAGSGWCIIMNVKTGEVLAMVSKPDFDPIHFGRTPENDKLNRAIGLVYEPGSVMKTITAAIGIDSGRIRPDSLYNTDRYDDRYYKLPGDAGHKWEERMSIRDAIIHSSNIVIGKLAYDIGPEALHRYFKSFGFGAKTGIELPGEEVGMLRSWRNWDKATWSRAGIGQGVGVTAIQLISAYQTIANDGIRMKPYIVKKIVGANGSKIIENEPQSLGRIISKETAAKTREMMLKVATKEGTARRAAIRGYSIAGKTGTAQKVAGGRGYAPGLYRATFVGAVPSGVVKRNPTDDECAHSEIVVLVTLDFDERRKYHQGGNSAGPVFKRIAALAMRYLSIAPDKPDELIDYDESDEFDKILDERLNVD